MLNKDNTTYIAEGPKRDTEINSISEFKSVIGQQDKVCVVEFWNASPHLETSLEIALRSSELSSSTSYLHWGSQLKFNECYHRSAGLLSREHKGIQLCGDSFISLDIKLIHFPMNYFNIDPYLKSPRHLVRLHYQRWRVGALLYANLIDLAKSEQPSLKNYRDLLQSMLESFIDVYHNFSDLIRTSNFTKVVVFNGRYIAPSAISAASKDFDIPVLYHDRGGENHRYMLSSFPVHNINEMQNMLRSIWFSKHDSDDDAYKLGRQIIVDRIDGKSLDGPSFVGNFSEELDQNDDRIIFSFFSSSEDEINSVPDPLEFPRLPWTNQMSSLHDLIKLLKCYDNVHLYIRLHPNLCSKPWQLSNWSELESLDFVTVIKPESPVSSYSLIQASRAVFTFTSTIGVEAMAQGTTSVILGPTYYDYLDSALYPSSCDELNSILRTFITTSSLPNSDMVKDAYKYMYCLSRVGYKYKYYQPISFNKGKFMGVDLSL